MSDPYSPPTEPPRDGVAGAEPGAVGAELAPGARVGGYRIVRLIGRGGMGEVYEGWDERLARRVALKLIPVAQGAQAESRARFWREARTLAALRHPGIVTIYEIGEDPRDQSLFIAMELVVGTSLAALAARALPTGRPAGLPARLVVTLGREVALALGAAHDAKVTHRDVKPANILIEDTGQVRVIDFGLARHVDDLDHRITRSGATLGTPGYMAPEAIDGQEVGPPADVFAVGILLYRLTSGVHPFERDSAQATALAIAGARFVPLHQVAPRVPTALAAAIERCLALRPTDRPADGRALAAELGAVAATLGVDAERDRAELVAWLARPEAASAPLPLDTRQAGGPTRRRFPRLALAGALATVMAVVAGAFVLSGTAPQASGHPDGTTPDRAGPLAASTQPPEPRADSTKVTPQPLDTRADSTKVTPQPLDTRAGSTKVTPQPLDTRADSTKVTPQPLDTRTGTLEVLPWPTSGDPSPSAPARPWALPPRPAVAVLGLDAERSGAAARAEVLADVLRVRLDEAPDAVLSVSGDLLAAYAPGAPLTRPGRAPGHIDVAIRGRYREGPEGVTAELDLIDTTNDRVLAQLARTAPDVMALGEHLTEALFAQLGAAPPARKAHLTRVPEAWSAWMAARLALRQFNLSTVEDNLRWALRLDPAFGLARADLLPMLRGLGRADEFATVAKALLADDDGPSGPVLTEHVRLQVEALALVGANRRADAIPKLHAILDRYPFDVDAADLLMAVRADGPTRDFQEVETIARRQLALAPRLETPASRLIRVLGTRNRAAEADALFRTLGLDRADPTLEDLFAELDLFAGRFTDASRGFTKAFATEPGNLYAEHMAIAAELLGGRCDKAAGLALDRIERKKLLGKDALLGWTYSLAVQALVCWEQWDGLEQVLTRWAAHDDSGRDQAFGMRERALFTRARILPVAARPARLAELEARWTRMLDARSVIPTNTRGQIENLVLQVTRDRTRLERFLAVAEHDASDLTVPAVQRSDGRLRVARLRGRLALLGVSAPGGRTAPTPAPTSVLEHYDDAVLDWSDVHGEGDTSARVEGLAQRADAATALASRASHPEDAARFAAHAEADWRAIVALGYPRLWVTDLWVVARHRLDEARRP